MTVFPRLRRARNTIRFLTDCCAVDQRRRIDAEATTRDLVLKLVRADVDAATTRRQIRALRAQLLMLGAEPDLNESTVDADATLMLARVKDGASS